MRILYSFFVSAFAKIGLPIMADFSPKMKEFKQGRSGWEETIKQWGNENQSSKLDIVWLHAASLGEFEQAVPVLEQLKAQGKKIVLTFFSPSGYRVKKNTDLAHLVMYLPLDTASNAKTFVNLLQPNLAIFVKYEFWPHYLKELKENKVKTVLLSGVFRKDMVFFKWAGKWMIKYLNAFEHFFLQDQNSAQNLDALGFKNYTVSGDTRFDRAAQIFERDNTLDWLENFKNGKKLLVVGSSWQEDFSIYQEAIKMHAPSQDVKILIAPHNIHQDDVNTMQKSLEEHGAVITYSQVSQYSTESLKNARFFILNTIGLLTKAYSYADIAYVGGAAGKTGLHNILEPATFGIPIIIGSNYQKFPEAEKLRQLAGLFSVKDASEFDTILSKLLHEDSFRNQTGMIAGHWINSNTGATDEFMGYLESMNKIQAKQLNTNWNADPNAPEVITKIEGDDLIVEFNLNYFLFEKFKEGDKGILRFLNCIKYSDTGTNDEGFHLGQSRIKPEQIKWGEFYEIKDGLDTNFKKAKFVSNNIIDIKKHYLFFFKDSFVECLADDYSIEFNYELQNEL